MNILGGTLLGTGAFGVVQKGFVEIGSRKSVIAIKTVKSGEDIDDFRATLLELKIMSTIGHHRHIVRLIAASTDEINNRKFKLHHFLLLSDIFTTHFVKETSTILVV